MKLTAVLTLYIDSLEPYRCCHRFFVYLGDLKRYHRDIIADNKTSELWRDSELYYRNALKILPSNGHPLNQIAVIRTTDSNDFEALYYYARALLVTVSK